MVSLPTKSDKQEVNTLMKTIAEPLKAQVNMCLQQYQKNIQSFAELEANILNHQMNFNVLSNDVKNIMKGSLKDESSSNRNNVPPTKDSISLMIQEEIEKSIKSILKKEIDSRLYDNSLKQREDMVTVLKQLDSLSNRVDMNHFHMKNSSLSSLQVSIQEKPFNIESENLFHQEMNEVKVSLMSEVNSL